MSTSQPEESPDAGDSRAFAVAVRTSGLEALEVYVLDGGDETARRLLEEYAKRHGYRIETLVGRDVLQRIAEQKYNTTLEQLSEQMDRATELMQEVTLGTLGALMKTLDTRSPHFTGHSRAVAMQATAVAQTMGLPDAYVEWVRIAAMLHDVGMIGVPDGIIDKPCALTDEEMMIVRRHCQAGAEIVEPMSHLGPVARFIREHHERLDGSGYPDAKAGEEISLGGQIVGIAEAWTAILEDRAYRKGRTREEAMDMMLNRKDQWFRQDVADALATSDVGLL